MIKAQTRSNGYLITNQASKWHISGTGASFSTLSAAVLFAGCLTTKKERK